MSRYPQPYTVRRHVENRDIADRVHNMIKHGEVSNRFAPYLDIGMDLDDIEYLHHWVVYHGKRP